MFFSKKFIIFVFQNRKKMKTKIYYTLLLILIFLSKLGFSQYEFIENKGQWEDNVKYKTDLVNGAIFLEDNSITYNFLQLEHSHVEENTTDKLENNDVHNPDLPKIVNGHAYRINFLNSKKANISVKNPKTDYNNYFISNDEKKWKSNVKKYEELLYENIYDGIDIRYYNSLEGLKYDIIVHAGADLNAVNFEYEGVSDIFEHRGEIVIKTSINTVKEGKPFAYQLINEDTVKIECKYKLENKILSFKLSKNYDKTKDLIIDPTLVFSTYTGAISDNWGFTATWDYADNVYSGGISFGTGYPTSLGAYQVNFAGGYTNNTLWCDVAIIKYNSNGTQRLFATYLGGSTSEEMPHSLVVTGKNELIIMGTTGSSDFPTTPNCFDNTFNGGTFVQYDDIIGFQNGVDIFVSKLSPDGTILMGSTFVGGSGNDGLNYRQYYNNPDPITGIYYVTMHGNDSLFYNYADGARGEVVVDRDDNIYVGTSTFSTNFPQGINPGWQTTNAGKQEGILFKLSSDLTQMVWSSYLGGTKDDAIFSITLNSQEEILVTGGTCSSNFPTTPGAYKTTYNGGTTDAFVSKLNKDGNFLIGSTFFGSNAYDNGYFVRTNKANENFICGQTKATNNTLIHNASYSIPNSGQFIAQFNPNLTSLMRSTVFGTGNGKPNISITAFEVDVCNRIYLSGWGREWTNCAYNAAGNFYSWGQTFGTVGMQVTPDAIQSQTDGQDFYIMVLDAQMSNLEYATFFGEIYSPYYFASGRDHVDGGTSRFDKRGNIIQSVCASCGGTNFFPTSSGAWSTTNNAANCNNAVFKINIIENLSTANFNPVPVGCAPYNVQFVNNSQGSTFLWNFGDGTTSTLQNPSHLYNNGGMYTVRLIVYDPASCNLSDTIERQVYVVSAQANTLPPVSVCTGHSIIIGPNISYPNGTSFSWSGGSGLSSYSLKNPVASPTQTTTYQLIATSVCNDTIYQTVEVHDPNITIVTCSDTTICQGGHANLFANSSDYISLWEWSDVSSFSNIISNNQSVSVSPSSTHTYYVRATENSCQSTDIKHVTVNVYNFNLTTTPNPINCYGSSITISVQNNSSGSLTYQWNNGLTTNPITVSPNVQTSYTVTVTNSIGCTTTKTITVSVDNLTIATPIVSHNNCFGDCFGNASISPNGISPYFYNWSNGNNTNSANSLCAGYYAVTVTDANSCTAETTIIVSEPNELTANFLNVVQPACDGVGYGSATISTNGGTPGYNYNWSYNNSGQNTNNQCIIGTNYITITDSHNCQKMISVEMIAPSDLTSSVAKNNPVSCFGYCDGSVSIAGYLGTAPYHYVWSGNINESQGSFAENLCAGLYVVTVIDAENCVYHQIINVTQPDSLYSKLSITSSIQCFGKTGSVAVEAFGGSPNYSYLWNTNNNNSLLNEIVAGIYSVTTTDTHGCSYIQTIELTEPAELKKTSELKNMSCNNNCNGFIKTSTYGGTKPYNYRWSNDANTANISSLCDGSYSITITDKNGCSISDNFLINNENHIPDLSVSSSADEIFEGQSVNLLAFSSESGTYNWQNAVATNIKNIPNPTVSPSETTLYQVMFVSGDGCVIYDTIRIKVKEIICKDPYIFVPNAFTPNGDGKNDYFKPYYPNTMIRNAYFAVYDRWGNIIYESDKLYDNGWDGTYKGEKLSSDVYAFYLKAECINGEQYFHKGNVTLLR